MRWQLFLTNEMETTNTHLEFLNFVKVLQVRFTFSKVSNEDSTVLILLSTLVVQPEMPGKCATVAN